VIFQRRIVWNGNSRLSRAKHFINLLSSPVKEETIDTHSKALRINIDPRWYGTFAEIGAGQEVVRWFFGSAAPQGRSPRASRLTT